MSAPRVKKSIATGSIALSTESIFEVSIDIAVTPISNGRIIPPRRASTVIVGKTSVSFISFTSSTPSARAASLSVETSSAETPAFTPAPKWNPGKIFPIQASA